MKWSGRSCMAALALASILFLGCNMPPASQSAPLTAAAAKQTLDSWNPAYCKVTQFYGFYQPGGHGGEKVAYVLMANPGNKHGKPLVFTARFRLLTGPAGQPQWFLTSLITHSAGLSRREGWDNLMIPVKEPALK
jgi:hypothetical protein